MSFFKKKNKTEKGEETIKTSSSTVRSVSLTNNSYQQVSRRTEVIKNETVNNNKVRSFSMYSTTETGKTNDFLTKNDHSYQSFFDRPGGIGNQRPLVSYRSAFSSEPLTVKRDAAPFTAISKPTFTPISSTTPSRYSPVYKSLPVTSPKPVTAPSTLSWKLSQIPSNKQNKGKEIVVKKTGKRYDEDCSIPVYKTSSKKRGEVLIINNVIFKERKDYRSGAEKDGKNMEELFKQLGFTVHHKSDLKAKQMKSEVERFSKSKSLKSVDISVVVVMSHGTNRETLTTDTQIFGTDDEGICIENLINNFTSQNCPSMINKPKIFFFQCCRGNNQNFVQTDATPIKPNLFADVLIAHSTIPGFVSNRDPLTGTWYIQTICDVFSEHAHEYHVEDMLKIVDEKLSRFSSGIKQTSSYESRGFKRCYFHPL